MAFDEIQFPPDISYGSLGGPQFATSVAESASGHEVRNSAWSAGRARFNVSHGVKNPSQLAELIAFFRARKGRARGFRFKDWSDYQASGEVLGAGDGQAQDFQLIKTYTSGSGSEVRAITKPVSGTPVVYLDGQVQGSGYSIDTTTGVVSFTSAPGPGVVVSADFEFDVPVRFDTDSLSLSLDDAGAGSWPEIPLVEIRN